MEPEGARVKVSPLFFVFIFRVPNFLNFARLQSLNPRGRNFVVLKLQKLSDKFAAGFVVTVLSGLLYTITVAAYRTQTRRYCYSEAWWAGTTPKLLSESGFFFRTILCSNCLTSLLSNILSNSYEILWDWNYLMQTVITDLKSKPCGDKSLLNNVKKPEEVKQESSEKTCTFWSSKAEIEINQVHLTEVSNCIIYRVFLSLSTSRTFYQWKIQCKSWVVYFLYCWLDVSHVVINLRLI